MNVILLSGGSGKRLWPLSNDVRSKQFLKIFRKADGTKESMAQRMYRMIREVDPEATITIATSENQIPQIRAQLGEDVGISVEPTRRDTFPAIALAAAYLASQGVGRDDPVVVCPVDPYVETGYYQCLKELSDEAGKPGAANLTLMGIEPTYPSEKYGYIIPTSKEHLAPVSEFKEKPDEAVTGHAVADGCENTHVVNELGIPMIALGVNDAVIAATPDGILVTSKARSPELKSFVGESRPMYERRDWGEYRVLDYKVHKDEKNSLTKELVIAPDQHISYQRHKHRTEVWTFTEGEGDLILEGKVIRVRRGDVAVIKAGMKHAIKAIDGELHIIEVQIGDELTEEDIERIDWDW